MGLLNRIAAGFRPLARRRAARATGDTDTVRRSNRVARVLVDAFDTVFGRSASGSGVDGGNYGAYYLKSPAVQAAVRVRADAVTRARLIVKSTSVSERPAAAGAQSARQHPLARLLAHPNPFWTTVELLRATETYFVIWGAAFWGIERDESGRISELWPCGPTGCRSFRTAPRTSGDSYTRVAGHLRLRRCHTCPMKSSGSADSTRWMNSLELPQLRRYEASLTWRLRPPCSIATSSSIQRCHRMWW